MASEILGLFTSPEQYQQQQDLMMQRQAAELAQLDQLFWITPINLLPLLLLVILSVRKVPAAIALMRAALFACLRSWMSSARSSIE